MIGTRGTQNCVGGVLSREGACMTVIKAGPKASKWKKPSAVIPGCRRATRHSNPGGHRAAVATCTERSTPRKDPLPPLLLFGAENRLGKNKRGAVSRRREVGGVECLSSAEVKRGNTSQGPCSR